MNREMRLREENACSLVATADFFVASSIKNLLHKLLVFSCYQQNW